MKKVLVGLSIASIGLLAGCSSDGDNVTTVPSANVEFFAKHFDMKLSDMKTICDTFTCDATNEPVFKLSNGVSELIINPRAEYEVEFITPYRQDPKQFLRIYTKSDGYDIYKTYDHYRYVDGKIHSFLDYNYYDSNSMQNTQVSYSYTHVVLSNVTEFVDLLSIPAPVAGLMGDLLAFETADEL